MIHSNSVDSFIGVRMEFSSVQLCPDDSAGAVDPLILNLDAKWR